MVWSRFFSWKWREEGFLSWAIYVDCRIINNITINSKSTYYYLPINNKIYTSNDYEFPHLQHHHLHPGPQTKTSRRQGKTRPPEKGFLHQCPPHHPRKITPQLVQVQHLRRPLCQTKNYLHQKKPPAINEKCHWTTPKGKISAQIILWE